MFDDTEEWIRESHKHPFLGENIGKSRYFKVWDDASGNYEDAGVGPLREKIIGRLWEDGIIKESSSVLDVGSGPGTYGIAFSEFCRHVTCLDSSAGMLERIKQRNISNIDCIQDDWDTFDHSTKYDVVFSSLCPSVNRPEALLKMESFSKGYCVYISSMNDDSTGLRRELWMEFGKDYTMNGYDTRYPFGFLQKNGRHPTLEIFEDVHPYEENVKETIEKEIKAFSFYFDMDEEKRSRIEKVVERRSVNGKVHYDGIKRLGLLIWKP